MALQVACCGINYKLTERPERPRRVLEAAGYVDIKMTEGYPFWRCMTLHADPFEARTPGGDPVEGVVCCTLLKPCTLSISHRR